MIPLVLKKWLGIPYPCQNPKSIFIGLIGGVGDLVAAAPSVAALKKKYPEATITFGVGDGIFFNTIKSDPHIDKFDTPFSYNVWKRSHRWYTYRKKSQNHDWVLLLDNPNREWWQEKKHLVDIYAKKCGVQLKQRRPVLYLNDNDLKEAQNKLEQLGILSTDKLLILAPETRSKKEMKEWPIERTHSLIQKINQNHDCKIITFVSEDSLNDYSGTIQLKGFPLGPSSAMISKAWMFLGMDNGLTHIASCFDIKLISIHIGYPVECCGPLSPMATAIAHEPFSSPKSISVEEVYKIFRKVF